MAEGPTLSEPPKDKTPPFQTESMDIVLELFRNEYDAAQGSIGTFEGRAGMLITLSGALLAFEGSNFIIPKTSISIGGFVEALEILSIMTLILSIIALILVISLRKFSRVNSEHFKRDIVYRDDPINVKGVLINTYSEAIIQTYKMIEKRSRWFNVGLWLLLSGLILVTMARVITLYVGG